MVKTNEFVSLGEGEIEATSAKAVLFRGDFMEKAEWLPKSQCEVEMLMGQGSKRATVKVAKWLADKNGWETE